MCGKGVGLGLFHSDSLESQSYGFDKITHVGPKNGIENFVRIVLTFFEKIKKVQNWRLCHFWVNFSYASHIPAIQF